jgi:hypothetical protein
VLIDEFLPRYDVREHHRIQIQASPQQVYAAIRTTDLFSSAITRSLFFLRGLAGRLRAPFRRSQRVPITIDTFIRHGFILLGETSPDELVLGLLDNWGATEKIRSLDGAQFRAFDRPGYAKIAWNFSTTPRPDGTTWLETETRVLCTDQASWRRFRRYWFVIAPFSGLIRVKMLQAIKRQAERA